MYQKHSEQLTELSSQMNDILALMNDLKNESDKGAVNTSVSRVLWIMNTMYFLAQ